MKVVKCVITHGHVRKYNTEVYGYIIFSVTAFFSSGKFTLSDQRAPSHEKTT